MVASSDPQRRSRVAVVLGGGGVTGGWFELGVLRALDAALTGSPTSEMDLFVGVSCGALVGSHLAAGIPSHMQMAGLTHRDARVLPPFERRHILRPNWRELAQRLSIAPRRMLDASWLLATRQGPHNLPDTLLTLGELLPSGFLDGAGLEQFVHHNLMQTRCQDRWDALQRELYVVAVDVDTHERVVFGAAGQQDVPISRAVRASSSFPPAYAPTRIHGRDYVDGGVDRNFHLDVAVAAGAQLILCINPLLPLMNDPASASVKLMDGSTGRISDKGLPGVLDQTVRMILHGRTTESVADTKAAFPDVDVVMLQPAPNDYAMFFYNVGRFSARAATARIGFLTAYAELSRRAEDITPLLARHGIRLDLSVLRDEAARLQGARRRKPILDVLGVAPGTAVPLP